MPGSQRVKGSFFRPRQERPKKCRFPEPATVAAESGFLRPFKACNNTTRILFDKWNPASLPTALRYAAELFPKQHRIALRTTTLWSGLSCRNARGQPCLEECCVRSGGRVPKILAGQHDSSHLERQADGSVGSMDMPVGKGKPKMVLPSKSRPIA